VHWQASSGIGGAQTLCFVPFAMLGAIAGLAVFERVI